MNRTLLAIMTLAAACLASPAVAQKSGASSAPAASGAATETLSSGVGIRHTTLGTGASPTASDTVKVHYRGTLADGKEFDSSHKRGEPTSFPLNRVVPCWTEGIQRLKVGGKATLTCPPATAYGSRGVRIGDTVAVFAQGPIGLCATAGAKLSGASMVIGVDRLADRLTIATRMGADHVIDGTSVDPVDEIMRLTGGRGVDVAIEALGTQQTFAACLRVLRPGGTLSSLGVYSTDLTIPLGSFAAGLGDHKIVTTLCPGGKERMRRLMSVIASGRVDLSAMVTHRFKLEDIEDAYELFGNQRDGVLKVAITP